MVRAIALVLLCAPALALAPAARTERRRVTAAFAEKKGESVVFTEWTKKKTLAEDMGNVDAKSKGLIGTINVEFVTEGEETKSTMAMVGQKLSEVATQADKFITYKCGKGECGTCEVRIDGQWVKTCQATVPSMADGSTLSIGVTATKIKSKKASGFFSAVAGAARYAADTMNRPLPISMMGPATTFKKAQSFVDGFRNNALGVVGLVVEGAKADPDFDLRMEKERKLKEAIAAKKAAKSSA